MRTGWLAGWLAVASVVLVGMTGCASTAPPNAHPASVRTHTYSSAPFTPSSSYAATPLQVAQPVAGTPFELLNGLPSLASTNRGRRPLSTALSHDRWLEVATVQLALTQLGSSLTVDGYYGPQTSAAVRHFQTARGITVDGIAGPETYRALIDALSELGGAVPAPAYTWTPAWTPGPVYTPSPMYFGTVCSDGWISSSTGSGTCSWHGGIR